MLSLQKPSAEAIRHFLDQQAKLELTYQAVGATATTPPAGFAVDHTRIILGEGERVFQTATAALRRWEQFNLGWLEAIRLELCVTQHYRKVDLLRKFESDSLRRSSAEMSGFVSLAFEQEFDLLVR